MQLSSHLAGVRTQLGAAAALGDDRTQQIAAALIEAVTPAVQLAIMGALASAADEVTAALLDLPGSPLVSIHLDGDDVRIDVRTHDAELRSDSAADDGEASARISLRLSDALKTEVEAAARREGVSVNAWLVRAATRAASRTSASVDAAELARDALRRAGSARRVTGWING